MARGLAAQSLLVALAMAATEVLSLAFAPKARAQAVFDIQDRLATYTLPLSLGIREALEPKFQQFRRLPRQSDTHRPACAPEVDSLSSLPDDLRKLDDKGIHDYFQKPENKQAAAEIVANYFRTHPDAVAQLRRLGHPTGKKELNPEFLSLPVLPPSFCGPSTITKLSFPFTPTYETNVLKSPANNSPGTSAGFGGTIQFVTPAPSAPKVPSFDVIGVSAQSQSVRYGDFATKNFDAATVQGVYEHFLSARGLDPVSQQYIPVEPGILPAKVVPLNLITFDTVAFGFQNQTTFVPTYHRETVDLFTPQVTFAHQNQDLFPTRAPCGTANHDPRQLGFCYYADMSVTLGQTISDTPAQDNTNIAVSVTPGWRIPDSDWKLTLPVTATGRAYENVAGGRDDALLQVGPSLGYAPPSFYDRLGAGYTVSFSVSATYNQNFSTVAKAAWHGYIILPTLTLAFQPPSAK